MNHRAEFPNDRPTDDTAAAIVLRNLRRGTRADAARTPAGLSTSRTSEAAYVGEILSTDQAGAAEPMIILRAADHFRATFAALLATGDAYELSGDTIEDAAKGTGFEIVAAPQAPGDVFVLRYHDGAHFLVGVDTSHDGPAIFVGVDIPEATR